MSGDVHYFSNGTEGEMWFAAWCEQCAHDHQASHEGDYENGCERIVLMFVGDAHPDLTVHPDDSHTERGFAPWRHVHCAAFTPCGACEVNPAYHPLAEGTRL